MTLVNRELLKEDYFADIVFSALIRLTIAPPSETCILTPGGAEHVFAIETRILLNAEQNREMPGKVLEAGVIIHKL